MATTVPSEEYSSTTDDVDGEWCDTQVVAAVQEEHRPVAAVELDEVVAADDVALVARHRDYEIEGDILGQHVEEVLTVHVSRKAFLDSPKERIQGTEVVHVLDHSTSPGNCW